MIPAGSSQVLACWGAGALGTPGTSGAGEPPEPSWEQPRGRGHSLPLRNEDGGYRAQQMGPWLGSDLGPGVRMGWGQLPSEETEVALGTARGLGSRGLEEGQHLGEAKTSEKCPEGRRQALCYRPTGTAPRAETSSADPEAQGTGGSPRLRGKEPGPGPSWPQPCYRWPHRVSTCLLTGTVAPGEPGEGQALRWLPDNPAPLSHCPQCGEAALRTPSGLCPQRESWWGPRCREGRPGAHSLAGSFTPPPPAPASKQHGESSPGQGHPKVGGTGQGMGGGWKESGR